MYFVWYFYIHFMCDMLQVWFSYIINSRVLVPFKISIIQISVSIDYIILLFILFRTFRPSNYFKHCFLINICFQKNIKKFKFITQTCVGHTKTSYKCLIFYKSCILHAWLSHVPASKNFMLYLFVDNYIIF